MVLKKCRKILCESQLNLGLMYYYGEGTDKDFKQSFIWQSKSAEQGNAGRIQTLGYMYYNGEGTVRKITKCQPFG